MCTSPEKNLALTVSLRVASSPDQLRNIYIDFTDYVWNLQTPSLLDLQKPIKIFNASAPVCFITQLLYIVARLNQYSM